MAEVPYITIKQGGQSELMIKKSRFICALARVSSEEKAKAFIDQVSTANRKATHNCFAYLIGERDQIQRESDNGEPSGTAGVPILEALKGAQLHDVCAVVTRYFGGIKLGAGGLIRAYSNTTTEAIHAVGRVQKIPQVTLEVTTPYPLYDQLTYWLGQEELATAEPSYATAVTVPVFVDESKLATVKAALTNQFNNQLTIKRGPVRFNEVPITEP